MVEEIAQAEREARKARLKTRMLWIIIILDILLFGYAVYEISALAINFSK